MLARGGQEESSASFVVETRKKVARLFAGFSVSPVFLFLVFDRRLIARAWVLFAGLFCGRKFSRGCLTSARNVGDACI